MMVALAWATAAPVRAADFEHLTVEPGKTSIYIGTVTITMTPFRRDQGVYAADYRAKVFPYFFANEHGWLKVDFNDEQLARLARGERVPFTGRAENSEKEPRHVEGHATPDAPGAKHGKIKVRVFVTKKIELIFNTTYRFE
ncbi:hypothetical protein DB347_15685 [Opitutaceae bacterium EW11]|nr:hypothetical protein DB347_15685 [Opitutaceae bacterium EW11]